MPELRAAPAENFASNRQPMPTEEEASLLRVIEAAKRGQTSSLSFSARGDRLLVCPSAQEGTD